MNTHSNVAQGITAQTDAPNNKSDWESVTIDTERLCVPGGWLYLKIGYHNRDVAMTFVPYPASTALA